MWVVSMRRSVWAGVVSEGVGSFQNLSGHMANNFRIPLSLSRGVRVSTGVGS